MIINNNIPALNTYRQLGVNQANSNKAMEKLSSGLRINRAGDDAAGLAISEKMRAQIRGLDQATRNSQDSISMIQTAEGAMNEVHSILQRMRELAAQAANDTNVSVDRDEIQKEINQLSSEINRIGNTTEFNTQRLINGDKANTFQEIGLGLSGVSGGLTGVSSSTLGTTTLVDGQYNIDITSTTATKTVFEDQSGNVTSGGTVQATIAGWTSGNGDGAEFAGNQINVTSAGSASSGDLLYQGSGSGAQIIIEGVTGADQIKVTLISASGASGAAGAGGVSGEFLVDMDASGKYVFDQHGVSFTINNGSEAFLSGGDQSTIQFTAATANASGVGTNQELWDSVDLVSGGAGPVFSGGIDLASGIAAGQYEISFTPESSGDTSGVMEIKHTDLSGNETIVANLNYKGGAISYDQGSISFDVKDLDDLGPTGASLTFQVQEQTVTSYTATLREGAGTSGSGLASASLGAVTNYEVYSGTAFSGSESGGTSANLDGITINYASISGLSDSNELYEISTLTSGSDNSMAFQIGANQNQSLSLAIDDIRADAINVSTTGSGTQWVEISRPHEALIDAGTMKSGSESGVGGESGKYYIEVTYTSDNTVNNGTNATGIERALDMSNHTNAAASLTVINDAIERVSSERSKLGAVQNRLEYTIANLGTAAENLQAAESRVRDVDMAREMMEFTKNNILSQASQAMLAQANQAPQSVLQLLR